jgi:molybdopterin converting factor small subunit
VNVQVRLFAVARQLAGRDTVRIELAPGATLGQLRLRLAEAIPELSPVIARMNFALGTEYADDGTVIPPDADLACIPPVSGG